jgi:hypothetical protein
LRPRMFAAALRSRDQRLHPIAKSCAAQVDLADDTLPWVVRRSPRVGDKTAVRLLCSCAIAGSELINRPVDFKPCPSRLQPCRRTVVAPLVRTIACR